MLLAGARFFKAAVFRRLDSWHGRVVLYRVVQVMVTFSQTTAGPVFARVAVPALPTDPRTVHSIRCALNHSDHDSVKVIAVEDTLQLLILRQTARLWHSLYFSDSLAHPSTKRDFEEMTAMIESSRYSRKSRRPAQGVLSALRASALFFLICSPVAEAQSLDHSTDELRKLNQSVDALMKKGKGYSQGKKPLRVQEVGVDAQ